MSIIGFIGYNSAYGQNYSKTKIGQKVFSIDHWISYWSFFASILNDSRHTPLVVL